MMNKDYYCPVCRSHLSASNLFIDSVNVNFNNLLFNKFICCSCNRELLIVEKSKFEDFIKELNSKTGKSIFDDLYSYYNSIVDLNLSDEKKLMKDMFVFALSNFGLFITTMHQSEIKLIIYYIVNIKSYKDVNLFSIDLYRLKNL